MNCAVHTNTEAVAYCRNCGKALCEECKRDVMGAVYCEPCIAARLQGQTPGVIPPGPIPPQGARVQSPPNPIIAGLLGFIPGVGAMYNGQFTKSFAHVVIFVLLIVATDRVPIIGILIGFFVFYMAFEAYKTAEAKLHGLPAPDPLGLDKLFGVHDSQTYHAHIANPAAQPTTAYSPVPPVPQMQPMPQVEPPSMPRDNTPVGAVILIGLGVIFLLDNLGFMHMHRLWPLFLIGIGLWIAYKRTIRVDAGGPR